MSKKILTGVVLMALLAASVSMTGCGSGPAAGTINLTDPVKGISCTGEDSQAVKLHSLSEQLFSDTWAACGENGNFLMSPLSLLEVLGMISEGAGGQTRQQLEDFFGYSTNEVSQYMRYLENNLPSEKDAKLKIANSILFLINAICFDAKWEEPYEKGAVFESEFYPEGGGISEASYMRSEEYGYVVDENTTGFVRPYKNGYSFVALLPEEGLTMAEYLAGFDGSKLENLLAEKKDETVFCTLPKFSGETSMKLMDMLSSKGVTDLFNPDQADLTPMADLNGESLYVSRIIQKTFIEVDEQGTRAAAITMAAAEGAAEPMNVVNLNRPFVYAIVEDASQLPVFLGVVMNPAE